MAKLQTQAYLYLQRILINNKERNDPDQYRGCCQRATSPSAQSPARASARQSSNSTANNPIEVKRDTPSTYLVKTGDTLSSISRKVYGTPNKWREIYGANRDRMATPESLKPGQVLRIPR